MGSLLFSQYPTTASIQLQEVAVPFDYLAQLPSHLEHNFHRGGDLGSQLRLIKCFRMNE